MRTQLILGDCLEIMKSIPDKSIDLVLTDPPYGTTACKWDSIIPFEPMWKELKRVRKDNAAICLFGSEPFSSHLRMSNIKEFKYDWIWLKRTGSNFATVKKQPFKAHEIISIFGSKINYYPIMEKRADAGLKRLKNEYKSNTISGDTMLNMKSNRAYKKYNDLRNPFSYQNFNNRDKDRGLHPTQKPVPLLEYLIKTYTLENETVLDFTMGSGSTGVACKNLNRHFIGIEKDEKYFEIAKKRIEDHKPQMELKCEPS
jgi:site-specific DNA-methyltransferase (adenine-specific)